MEINALEIDGQMRAVSESNVFRKDGIFRAVITVDVSGDKIVLDNVGKVVKAHGLYHGEPMVINVQKAELIQDSGDEVSICVYSDLCCNNSGDNCQNCSMPDFFTVINDTCERNKTQLLPISDYSALSMKHHGRLGSIVDDYVLVSGNDMSVKQGHFILENNGIMISEPINLSRENLKNKNLGQTTMLLRRVFFDMLKQTRVTA